MIKRLRKLSLIAILLGMQLILFAQTKENFFTPVSKEKVSMSDVEKTKFKSFEKNPVYKSVQFVKIGAMQKFIDNGEFRFNIPGQEEEYIAIVKDFEYNSPDDFIWKGNLIDRYGNVVIFYEKGSIYGHVVIENEEYEIQTLGKNNILIEIDTKYIKKSKCVSVDNHDIEYTEEIDRTKNNKSNTGLVRILVLYTTNAQNAVSNIGHTANIAVNQIKDALSNSDVSYSQLRVERVRTQHLNFTEHQYDISGDVENLRNNSTAQSNRNQYRADIVILLTNGDYKGYTPYYGYFDIYGVVADIGPNNNSAYAIVEVDVATSNLTFAHETAHLFGGRHQNDATGTYEHGYYFRTGWGFWKKYYRTIMGTGDEQYSRIQYYSNPNVDYNNKSTGTSSSNDVARKLRTSRYEVENFRPNPPSNNFIVNINGPTVGYGNVRYNWSSTVMGGTPTNYSWSYKIYGSSSGYRPLTSNTGDLTYRMPGAKCVTLKLTVQKSGGGTATDYHFVLNPNDPDEPPHMEMKNNGNNKNEVISETITSDKKLDNFNLQTHSEKNSLMPIIYPNPATTSAKINFFTYGNNATITITTIDGKVVENFTESIAPDTYFTKTINTKHYKNGIYFVNIYSGKKTETYKLIVNK